MFGTGIITVHGQTASLSTVRRLEGSEILAERSEVVNWSWLSSRYLFVSVSPLGRSRQPLLTESRLLSSGENAVGAGDPGTAVRLTLGDQWHRLGG
jgi:hypothetical protein